MITDDKKREIVGAIEREKELLTSYANVAKKLKISPATISNGILKPQNWHLVSATMWTDIASALGVSLVSRNWNIAPTSNVKIMHRTLKDAQKEALFMIVSEKAGSGKSSSIADFIAKDTNHSVYSLQCEEWSRKGFLIRLATELGVTADKYDSVENLTEGIVRFFKQRAKEVTPLLILDEADKLKPAAKRFIIPLYNRLEDEIGLVWCGTENLEKEIKNGVRRHEKGYDELESRFGRRYVHLVGNTEQDVTAICMANGISDAETIAAIWAGCSPEMKMIGKKYVAIVEDARTIKRGIKAAKIRIAHAA